jgi:hypothetical protein
LAIAVAAATEAAEKARMSEAKCIATVSGYEDVSLKLTSYAPG